MLGILAVRGFLLAVEEHFGLASDTGEGNKVACNNKGALFTFAKRDKKIPVVSCNVDILRALQEVN